VKAILFLHSTGTSPLLWSLVPESHLGQRKKIAPTYLGYPPNPLVPRGTTCDVNEDAAYISSIIPQDVTQIDVVGHSYGGLVAAKLVNHLGKRLHSLFLYEPILFAALLAQTPPTDVAHQQARELLEHPWFLHDHARGGTFEWLEVFIDYWNQPGQWSQLPDVTRNQALVVGWKIFQEVRSAFFVPNRFDELVVSVPITIMFGANSPATSRAMAKAVAELNPHVRLIEAQDMGHMGPLTHPTEVHTALRDHLLRS